MQHGISFPNELSLQTNRHLNNVLLPILGPLSSSHELYLIYLASSTCAILTKNKKKVRSTPAHLIAEVLANWPETVQCKKQISTTLTKLVIPPPQKKIRTVDRVLLVFVGVLKVFHTCPKKCKKNTRKPKNKTKEMQRKHVFPERIKIITENADAQGDLL